MLGFSFGSANQIFHVHVIWPCSFNSRNPCYRNAHTNTQTSAGCNVKNQQFKYMSVGIWLNKLWSVHNMQYYIAAITKNEVDHDSCQYRLPWHIRRMKKHVTLCELLMYINDTYQKISLEGYILKILTSCFWVLGWVMQECQRKKKFLIICYFYNFKKCKLISFLWPPGGQWGTLFGEWCLTVLLPPLFSLWLVKRMREQWLCAYLLWITNSWVHLNGKKINITQFSRLRF